MYLCLHVRLFSDIQMKCCQFFTVQSAVRGWLTRIKVDEMRLRVCKAVEIQAAWRAFVVRKRLIQLKQAAIILQAHWRGKCDRRRYSVYVSMHMYMKGTYMHVCVYCIRACTMYMYM